MVNEIEVIEAYDRFREATGKKYAEYFELYSPDRMANEICFKCQNCIAGCEWADSAEPIKGWKAIKTIDHCKVVSYKILYCPKFNEGDASEGVEYDLDGCYRLLTELARQSAEIYREAARTAKEEKHKFLHRTVGIHFDPGKWKKALNQMQYESVFLENFTSRLDKQVGFEYDEHDRNALRGMYG